MNETLIRELLGLRPFGAGPWVVFQTNKFGFYDRENKMHEMGSGAGESVAEGLVELLNAAPQLLADRDTMFIALRGKVEAKVGRSAIVNRVAELQDGLRRALATMPEDDALAVELRKLL